MTPGAHGKARGPGLQGRGWGGRNVPVEALFVRNIASSPEAICTLCNKRSPSFPFATCGAWMCSE